MEHAKTHDRAQTPGLSFYAMNEAVLEVFWHEPSGPSVEVPEALVQDVWRLQQIDAGSATTVQGQPLLILSPGILNSDSGPDFLEARIQFGGQNVEGSVEIHTRSGTWYEHNHHEDAAYDDVILHVSLEADLWTGRLRTRSGRVLPELILAPLLRLRLRSLLHAFRTRRQDALACGAMWNSVPPSVLHPWLRKLGRQRLRSKVRRLGASYLDHPDLDQILYELVLLGLGYSKNAQPMLELAQRLPINLLRRLPTTVDVQAALLGTAGLLPDPAALASTDRETIDFVMLLREKFACFTDEYRIEVMAESSWRYFRLRPSNFPPLRIAQAAGLASRETDGILARAPLSRLVEALDFPRFVEFARLLRVDPGAFWFTHVRLDRSARRSFPFIGAQRARAILLNAVAPVLLLHAEQNPDLQIEEKVFALVGNLGADNDEITRIYSDLGTPLRDGLDGQGLHELYRSYCSKARCLACDVGRHLLEPADH